MRQNEAGQWESVAGYNKLYSNASYTAIKAAIEVNDSFSSSRFILFQNGTKLYRLNYDAGDGNGYENETAAEVTLPTGFTIGASATLKFFITRGVIRITGATDAYNGLLRAMWYGYVTKTLFDGAWELNNADEFESTTESWVGTDATVAVDATHAHYGTKGLMVTQTGADGYGYVTRGTVSGARYQVSLWVYRATDAVVGNIRVKVGKTANSSDYYTADVTARDGWAQLFIEFLATGNNVYITVIPAVGDAGTVCWVDTVWFDYSGKLVQSGWMIQPAPPRNTYFTGALSTMSTGNLGYVGVVGVFDDGQYSLPIYITNWSNITKGRFLVTLTGFSTYIKRLTAIGILVADTVDANGVPIFYVDQIIELDSQISTKSFTRSNYYYLSASPTFLYINHDLAYNADVHKSDGYWCARATGVFHKVVAGTDHTAHVVGVGSDSHGRYIEFYENLNTLGLTTGVDVDQAIVECGVEIQNIDWAWNHSTDAYSLAVGVDFGSLPADEVYDFIDIPAGTTDIETGYDQRVDIGDRSYINSDKQDEDDVVRYSPLYQPDVFPSSNIIQTEVGDLDSVKALAKIGDRLIIIKRKSFSQISMVGTEYSEDIGLANRGVYSTNGVVVIDNIVYFMDDNDVALFDGTRVDNLLLEKLRLYYKAYISTSSFIAYNKRDDEIWLILNGKILVNHRGFWYLRQTDITPVGWFLDTDNNLIVYSASKIVKYNHVLTTFSEVLNFSIKTRLFDLDRAEVFKKLLEVKMMAKSTGALTVTTTDVDETAPLALSITPSTSIVDDCYCTPKYLFKRVDVTIAITTPAVTTTAKIRDVTLVVERWK